MVATVLGAPPVEAPITNAHELSQAVSNFPKEQLIYGHFRHSHCSPALGPEFRIVVLTRHPLDRLISEIAYAQASGVEVPDRARTPQQLARELLLGCWDGKSWADGYVTHDYGAHHNLCLKELVIDWIEAGSCLLVKFEDLIARPSETLEACLTFWEIPISRIDVRKASESVSFESLSGGRSRGVRDQQSHYRCGIVGEWASAFSETDVQRLTPKYATVFRRAGYAFLG